MADQEKFELITGINTEEEYKEQAYDWYVDEFDPLEYMEKAIEEAVRTDMINAENEERENW